MKFNRRNFLGASVAASGGLFVSSPAIAATLIEPPTAPLADIVTEALGALNRHAARITDRKRIGISDFRNHSGKYRFHIVDVERGKIMRSLLVSHGRGSDPQNSGYVQRFSNVEGSNASSRGSYVCGEAYVGQHGRSRRLHGLEPQNDNAYDRAIVIHGASYVDAAMARDTGRVGRSFGCFAFEQSEIASVLELLGEGQLLYATGREA